jgi:hypothetical protein
MLLSTTSYCNIPITNSLNPQITLTPITGYFNMLVKLASRYLKTGISFKIILPHTLLIGNN